MINLLVETMPFWQSLGISLLVLMALILLMNKGDKMFINILAQDPPLFGALGTFFLLYFSTPMSYASLALMAVIPLEYYFNMV